MSCAANRKFGKFGKEKICIQPLNPKASPMILMDCNGLSDVQIIYNCISNGRNCPNIQQEFLDDIMFSIKDCPLGRLLGHFIFLDTLAVDLTTYITFIQTLVPPIRIL